MAGASPPAGRPGAPRDGYAAGAEAGPGALAFVHDRGALARRFLLAELLAPPLALRRRTGGRGPGSPPARPPEAAPPVEPSGGGRR